MPEPKVKPALVMPGDRRFDYACRKAMAIMLIALDPDSDLPFDFVSHARAQVDLSVQSSLCVWANWDAMHNGT